MGGLQRGQGDFIARRTKVIFNFDESLVSEFVNKIREFRE
jgi:hypothetical protein